MRWQILTLSAVIVVFVFVVIICDGVFFFSFLFFSFFCFSCRRCIFPIKQHQGHVTNKEQTIADSMAIVDHKWEMRVEVGRGAFAIVELVRHPKNDIAMILKTVSKKNTKNFGKNHKSR